jgi:single-stranded-DNA-specific exonuclease
MWQPKIHNPDVEKALLKASCNRLLARLLSQRNISADDYNKFLEVKYENIEHPFKLAGMEKALKVFKEVVKNKGKSTKALIYTDYDCDGLMSAAIIKELCMILGLDCKTLISSRLKTGYGLSDKSLSVIKELAKDYKPDLLFVLDSGSNNEKEIIELKLYGIDKVIIIDHHELDPEKQTKSADAFVNWHLNNHEEMCAAGEVFQFIRAVRTLTKKIDPIQFLSMASIATIGDAMPIKGINRIIVKNGLKKYALNHVVGYGISTLMFNNKIRNLTQTDVAYKIVPLLNAVGRMGDADLAYRFLVDSNRDRVEGMAKLLDGFNTERKRLQKKIEIEVEKIIKKNPKDYPHGVLVYNPEWETGIVGIVAAKIVEKFKKPALVAGEINGEIKGSSRCPHTLNIKDILDNCKQIFENYGGHAQAAGVTLNRNFLNEANKLFNEACKKYTDEHSIVNEETSYYDAELKIDSVSLETAKTLLNNLYPYCNQTNPEPIFKISSVRIENCQLFEPKGWKILSFSMSKNGVKSKLSFKMFTDKFGTELEGTKVNLYFQFPQSYENDNFGKYQLSVIDIEKT